MFNKLFDKLFERIRQIKESEGELSLDVLFDFNKIYKPDVDSISIFSEEEEPSTFRSALKKKNLKVK